MTRYELLSDFVLSINEYLQLNDEILEGNVIIDEDLKLAFSRLKSLNPPQNFNLLINSLEKIIDKETEYPLNENYDITGILEIIDFSQACFENRNRAFAYSDSDFGFFSSKTLFDNGELNDIALPKYDILFKQIQEFLERCYTIPDKSKLVKFLDCIREGNINAGFVLNKNNVVFEPLKHYSYIYLCFLNNSKSIDLQSDLIYSSSIINNSLTIDNSKIYEQFFDIYDVINELNQAPDILSRFLKMYHILEYLVYRVYLVDLTRRVANSKIFVREFVISAEKMKTKEKDTFKKNFEVIFTPDKTIIENDLSIHSTSNAKIFLGEKGIVKGFVESNLERVAELVYGIRCSIVHNKESEFHLTLTNYEDYYVIIPLITQIIKTIESLIVQKIANNEINISYSQKSINLY